MKKLKIILQSNWFYIGLIIITCIYSILYINYPRYSKLNKEDNTFTATILKIEIDGDLLKLELSEKEKIIGNYYFKTEDEKLDFIKNYELGDLVYLTGTLSLPSNNTSPNLFNYKEYLKRKKIYYILNIESIEKIKDNTNIFYKIKNSIIKHIDSYQSNKYLRTFILGDKTLLEDEIITSYQENGISHLLAISGMHVSLLSGILLFILKRLKLKEDKSYFLVCLFLTFYMILSGCTPSVSRAIILFVFLFLNKLLSLKIKTLYLLIMTFSILTLINPYYLLDVGFEYSFLISFYLILLQNTFKDKSYFKSLLAISIVSFLVSFPITIYYFYQVNFLSIILNLIFVPLVSFLVFPLSIITFLCPFLDSFFGLVTSIMEDFSTLFNSISIFKTLWMKPSIIWIILYYIFLTLFLYFRKKIGIFLVIILLCYQYFNLIIFPKTFFMMIDVGQGDSLLIHSNNKTMLIDTGGKITYDKEKWQERSTKSITGTTLLPLLKSLGIRKIDYLVLSHGDYDHVGEAINLIDNFKIKKVIFNQGEFSSQEIKIIELLNSKNITYSVDSTNSQYFVGKFKLLSLNEKQDNENDSSIVFLMMIDNYKFLLMGDSSTSTEDKIIKKYNLADIDFLKVGHHGSNTSSSKEFISSINPKYSLISVGKNNRYNHPKEEVLETLANTTMYRTDLDGSILVNFNKNNYKVNTYSP